MPLPEMPDALADAIYVQYTTSGDWMLGSPNDDSPVLISATREPLDFVRACVEACREAEQ